jgi:hypothetical protein
MTKHPSLPFKLLDGFEGIREQVVGGRQAFIEVNQMDLIERKERRKTRSRARETKARGPRLDAGESRSFSATLLDVFRSYLLSYTLASIGLGFFLPQDKDFCAVPGPVL